MHSRDERHFNMLFEYAPISLWEEDFSAIKQLFDRLHAQGVMDLMGYFDEHPNDVEASMALLKVVDVNRQTLAMYGAETREELILHLKDIFRDEMRIHFKKELLALWQGDLSWSGEGLNYTLQGEPFDIQMYFRLLPGSEETFSRILIAVENITARKQAERALQKSELRFRDLFDYAPISLWEEDYSALKNYFDGLRQQGVADLRVYLDENPKAVETCMGLIHVIDVNRKTLQLFEASDREELVSNLDKVFRDEMSSHFVRELVDMWNGKTAYEREGINYSMSGSSLDVHLDWRLMPGHEIDFSWVLVAIQDITARKKAEEYLRYLGSHDVMTGLYNRTYFEETLQEMEKDRKDPVTMIVADLNGLKAVNDKLGHPAGDNLIRRASEVLKASFEENSIVARIGGDEFIVILTGVDDQITDGMLERIKSLIVLNNKYYREPELSISLGVSTSRPGLSLERTISMADDAMYQDKAHYYHRRRND
jgi:diguanylate cyclase (GGDEF)-like protein